MVVSARLPSNRWTSRGNPAGSTRSPTWTCGSNAVLLAHPHPPQVVLVLVLHVQRGRVIHHQGGVPSGAGRVGQARLGDLAPVVPLDTASQGAVERVQPGRRHPQRPQDPDRVGLAGWLDDPGQHHRPERRIRQDVEPQVRVGIAHGVPQHLRPRPDGLSATHAVARTPRPCGRSHHWCGHGQGGPGPVRDRVHPRRDAPQIPQIEGFLARVQPLPRNLEQQLQTRVVVAGADVLDAHHHIATPGDDLDRDRTRRRPHLPDPPRHHPPTLPPGNS